MIRLKRLTPDERVLLVSPVNNYKIAGPGRVWLTPRQQVLATFYIGPKGQAFKFDEVRTSEDVAVDIKVQITYRVAPELFSKDLLPRIPILNDRVWPSALNWHTEYVLRTLVAQYPWRELSNEKVKEKLQRQMIQTLNDRVRFIGLSIIAVSLVNAELPVNLQKTLIQAERDTIEAGGRAEVLKKYFEIFGENLAQAMPYIVQWELMNSVHKNGDPKILLTSENMLPRPSFPINEAPIYQLQLPVQ